LAQDPRSWPEAEREAPEAREHRNDKWLHRIRSQHEGADTRKLTWREEIACMRRFTRNNGITEGFHTKMEWLPQLPKLPFNN
jgi:hypothetical protein